MPAEAVAMPPKPNRPATMATTRNTNAQYSIVGSPVLSEALRPRRRLLLTRTQMPVPGFRLPSAAPGARRRAGRRLVVLVMRRCRVQSSARPGRSRIAAQLCNRGRQAPITWGRAARAGRGGVGRHGVTDAGGGAAGRAWARAGH